MSDNFLPEEYKVPGESAYMKFQLGENKFRIMSKPIIGWEDWKDKKPLRFRMNERPTHAVDPEKAIKHFWAMVVWNYATNKICVLEITQKGVQNSIAALAKDADWGNPLEYDLKVTKTGEGLGTEYSTAPVPHKPAPADAVEALKAKPCNLEALFDGNDPFAQPF